MQNLTLALILSIYIVNVYALPIQMDTTRHSNGIVATNKMKNSLINKRVVNYNTDAGSVTAATTIDATTAAIAGLDSASKAGAATGTKVLNALVNTGQAIVSIAGEGLTAAGTKSFAPGSPPAGPY